MKKTLAILLPVLALLAAALWALAAGGADDPLASLSYLEGTFSDTVDRAVEARLDTSDDALRSGTVAVSTSGTWQESRLKRGDTLTGTTGTGVLLLAGEGQVTSGTVVDVTAGTVAAPGTAMTVRHRYLVAEDTTAVFSITSKTAVLDHQGGGSFSYSNTTDYNAIAAALKTLHLFRGSGSGYGQGFDLENPPNRIQALIMFIRVLGEEEEALAWSGTIPFRDVAVGSQSEKYVGYAYSKGYTNGYTATEFRPSQAVNAYQYTEFLLRAMGYSVAGENSISTALDRALTVGILTDGEASMLQRERFLRAELVYLSYYALEAPLSGSGETLADVLQDKGVFTRQEWRNAQAAEVGPRF